MKEDGQCVLLAEGEIERKRFNDVEDGGVRFKLGLSGNEGGVWYGSYEQR